MKTPTIKEFKAWSRMHHGLAYAVIQAKAFAQVERERVNAYILPLFNSFRFSTADTLDGRPINDPEHLYLCKDEELCKDFYEACDKAHREHGFTGKHGHCPALMAEHLQIIAENALLDAGCKLMGIESGLYGENREKMLEILLGACMVEHKKAA